MRKNLKLALLVGVLLPLAFAPVVGHAASVTPQPGGPTGEGTSETADNDLTAHKSASVEITGGKLAFAKTNGLDDAPSFNFNVALGTTNLTNIPAVSNSAATSDVHTYNGTDLIIDNNEGTGHKWSLDVSLTDFTNNKQQALGGAKLNFNPSLQTNGNGNDDYKKPTIKKLSIVAGSPKTTLLDATSADGIGMGETIASLKDTTLTLPSVPYSGSYLAQLTYTLSSGPAN